MEELASQPYRVLARLLCVFNYYFAILIPAVIYDTTYRLAGGPATMFFGFMVGPAGSILLCILTNVAISILMYKERRNAVGWIVLIHLVLSGMVGVLILLAVR